MTSPKQISLTKSLCGEPFTTPKHVFHFKATKAQEAPCKCGVVFFWPCDTFSLKSKTKRDCDLVIKWRGMDLGVIHLSLGMEFLPLADFPGLYYPDGNRIPDKGND